MNLPLEIWIFYGLAGLLISAAFYCVIGRFVGSFVYSVLIVFVSSEFWEIPIFVCAYLGCPGFGSPEILNHVLVGVMAAFLIYAADFHLDPFSCSVLLLDLAVNTVFLLIFPGVLSGWILRTLSLISLSAVFLRSVFKIG